MTLGAVNFVIVAYQRTFKSLEGDIWDQFAAECDAGYRSSFRFLHATHILRWPRARILLFELFLKNDSGEVKIGQAAVKSHKRDHAFEDQLQILPDHADKWGDAMAAVIKAVGTGNYRYGYPLSVEKSRYDEICKLPCASDTTPRDIVVQYIDFAKWDSWDEYYKSISTNSKRNANRAEKEIANLNIEQLHGVKTLKEIFYLVNLRDEIYTQKDIKFEKIRAALSYFGRLIGFGGKSFAASLTSDKKYLASISGVIFNDKTYYLDGGRDTGTRGAAWYLTIEMLRICYARASKGKFIMGYVDYALHDDAVGGGLLRSRQSCRTTDLATSIVSFKVV
jgi:hypothetical protein